MALLFLAFASPPAAGQASTGGSTVPVTPPTFLPSAAGFVTAVDGPIVTLLGSPLLRIDVSGATILAADATGGTPPQITPGAYIFATLEPIAPPTAGPLPPPLIAIAVAVRPAGTALLEGEVQAVGTDSFTLLFRTILVDANTVFLFPNASASSGGLSDLKPGMQVAVWVRVTSNGLTAVRVVVLGPPPVSDPIFFRGVVKVIGTDSWTIGDYTVGITAATKIVGDPQVGDTVDVVAIVENPPNPMMGMPSRLVALSITKVILPPSPVAARTISFTGPVQAMPISGTLGVWKIAGRSVTVTGLTTIEGNPAVGSTVAVTGYTLPGLTAAAALTPSSVTFVATDIQTAP